jgi:predicted esterase
MKNRCVWRVGRNPAPGGRGEGEVPLGGALRILAGAVICLLLVRSGEGEARGDSVRMRNGMIYRGIALRVPGLNLKTSKANNVGPIPHNPILMIDDGVREYFVPYKLMAETKKEAELSSVLKFKIPQRKAARAVGPSVLGGFKDVRPFNEYGHGMVTLNVKDRDLEIFLGMTELRPDYATVEGLNYDWEFGVSLNAIPVETVRAILQKSVAQDKPKERQAIVLFYIQAELYSEAKRELAEVVDQFPELAEWGKELQPQINEGLALKGINEIQRRMAAGQHALAYQHATSFPTDGVSAEVTRQAREIVTQYDDALETRNEVQMQLDLLQSKLPPDLADQIRPLRSQLADELHFENIGRLGPFLRSERDPAITPEQRLALAFSGWVLGESAAGLELKDAIRLWEARFLTIEYLQAEHNPPRQAEIVESFKSVEGISVERLVQMLPQMPLAFDGVSTTPREIQTVTVAEPMNPGAAIEYQVVLPPEYSPHHRYPALVVLHDAGKTPEDELKWWAGDIPQDGWAQRRGYITIAPVYMDQDGTSYQHGSASHRAVIEAVLHARKRFSIDSDRIAVGGHGAGGDAVFDMATGHPDLFAAAIPICGHSHRSSTFCYQNAKGVAWYVISGDKEPPSVQDDNARDINRMMKEQNVTLCSFKRRGFENYREELPRVFDWLETTRRPPLKDFIEFEAKSVRVTDNEFAWLTCSGFPPNVLRDIPWDLPNTRPTPKTISGTITAGGTIYVSNPGRRTTIWLSPDLIDFENRVQLHVNGTVRHRDFVKPDIAATLERLAITGDRQRPVWAKLDVSY